MKTYTLAGLVIAGVLATSAVQAASSSNESVEALYSGLSAGQVQQIHKASEIKAAAHKSTCVWHEAEEDVVNPAIAAYLGNDRGLFLGEKDYLAASNQNFVC